MSARSGHSRLPPSGSTRWIYCSGSINLCDKCPQGEDTTYGAEGTAAHMLGEKCLMTATDTYMHKGKVIKVEGSRGKSQQFEVTEEMVEAVQVYVDYVRSLVSAEDIEMKRKILMIEEKLDVSFIHPDIGGTGDAIVYTVEDKVLDVCDLKYGAGIIVEPEWNSQLMIYGLGALHAVWTMQTEKTRKVMSALNIIDKVRLSIIQPRAFHEEGLIRTWEISSIDLMFWGQHVLMPAAKATDSKDAKLKAGPHCRFCDALPVCDAQVKHALQIAQTGFDDPILPDPKMLTPEHITKVMSLSTMLTSWVDSVKVYAQRQMEQGVVIPGYKLVSRRSNRRWRKGSQIHTSLYAALGDAAFVKKPIGIPAAEKLVTAQNASPEAVLGHLYEKPEAGLTIASVEDNRREISVAPVAEAFVNDEEFLC